MSDSRPPQPVADHNLLFGILALQMDFIRRDALIAAMNAWVLQKTKPLGQILCEQGDLSAERRSLLEALVQEHVKQHGNDTRCSLVAAHCTRSVQQDLQRIADADVQASVSNCSHGSEGEATLPDRHFPSETARYRRLRSHARGGLGEVFVAEDTELHREVALKEIQPQHADNLASRVRFILEAEITGGLEHPGIVPVYGLGVYADGRPYYAMRFIRGDSLKEAIELFHAAKKSGGDPGARSLAFRQLLRRFNDACNAVAYAHSRGVLHRDLKPANIMLGKFGETLVVDWGLAKAGLAARNGRNRAPEMTVEPTLRPASGSDVIATQPGLALGTPLYMSPEQAAGLLDQLGPASDIYSLGSTLYVLLTGEKPFRGANTDEVLEQVRRGRFAPPRQVKPDTPPALDAICCKAMALQPSERYRTALDLADDIEHWLADEPVAAYVEPWTIRLSRWGRRHRTALVAVAVFLLSAVVALSVSTVLLWREQQKTAEQKRLAEQNYELSQAQSFNLIDLIETSEADIAAVPALHSTRLELLKAASRACGEYLARSPDDLELQKRTAKVYRYTANVYRLTNQMNAAEPLYQDSLRLQEGLAERFPEEILYRERLAETLRDYASAQEKRGRLRDAAVTLDRAGDLAEKLQAAEPDKPAHRRTLATTLLSQSINEHTRGLNAESEQIAKRAVELFRDLVSLPPGMQHPYDSVLLGAALNALAVAERDAGRLDVARSIHNEAIKTLQGLLEKPPNGVNPFDVAHFLAHCRFEQSRTLAKLPDKQGLAETNFGKVADKWQSLAQDFPKIPMYRESQAAALLARGELRAENKQISAARADLGKSRTLLEVLVKEYPDWPSLRGDLGRVYAALGRLARGEDQKAEAADWFAKAVETLGQAVEQSPDNAQNRRSLEKVRTEQRYYSVPHE
jgi:eukaryotic-like serine/threonine-protein kinase